jgi:sirohydrochlorin ferrochelatase
MADVSTAVLLIAHGSRRAEANADLVRLAEMLRERGEYAIVEPSYLEIAEPTIPQGAAACIAQGAQRVLMLPFFLSAGSHVVDDLERHRRELAAAHPGVEFRLCPPLGLHPLMLDIIRDRLGESH